MIGILDLFKMYFNFNHYLTWIGFGIGLITIYTFVSKFILGKFSFKSLIFVVIIIFLALFLIKTLFFNPYAKNSEYCNKLITKTDTVLKKVDECIKEKTEFGNELLNSLNIYNEMLTDLNDIKDLNIQQQNEIKTKIKALEEAIIKVKADIESRKQTIIKLETEKETKIKAKNTIDNKINDLEEKLKTETDPNIREQLKNEITQLQNEQTKLVQELINIDTEIKKLNNEVDYLNANLKTLNICKSTLENDLETLESFGKKTDFQITSIEERKNQIQIEINQNEIQLQELKIKKRNYEEAKKTLNELLTLGKTHEMENAWNLKNIDKSITNLGETVCNCMVVNQGIKFANKALDWFSGTKSVPTIVTSPPIKVATGNQLLDQAIKSKTQTVEGKPLMIDESTYQRILKSLEDDLANLENEITFTQNQRKELQYRIEGNVENEYKKMEQKIKELIATNSKINSDNMSEIQQKIWNYNKIQKEFIDDKLDFQGKANTVIDLYNKKYPLNEELKLAILAKKEELKLKNPSLTRAQKRYLQSKGFDFPSDLKS
ncbi:MAG: hypothetical protein ACLTFB_01070 [Candidatus Phytoplasma pyri]